MMSEKPTPDTEEILSHHDKHIAISIAVLILAPRRSWHGIWSCRGRRPGAKRINTRPGRDAGGDH